MNQIRVYIASPYSIGNKERNVVKSLEMADKLMDLGYNPYVPLLKHFQNKLFPRNESDWIKDDDVWLASCDIVFRMPGESKGADNEESLARCLGKPVCRSIKELDTHKLKE